ncbi:MAG: 3-isopropylmalate dehydratase small subunit [Gammaproteobacteria bacterium]|nr:3-isopropylmalate dehydratase small subunit [Gammaproteobacteria bacterium]
MKAFNQTTGILIPMPQANLDTDRIIPKQYLKTVQRSGLGLYLFDEMRYHDLGFPGKSLQERQPRSDFILNTPPFNQGNKGNILVTGDNFGCGSSREHAVWSLMDFGIEAVIAPSFAEIFFINCSKNGLLTVELTAAEVKQLMDLAQEHPGSEAKVTLESQLVEIPNGNAYKFAIDPQRKKIFAEGLDDIAITLEDATQIKDFENKHHQANPWLKDGIY